MNKRIKILLSFTMLVFSYAVYSLFSISINENLSITASRQQMTSMSLYNTRGTIFDCNLQELTNSEYQNLYIVKPNSEIYLQIKGEIDIDEKEFLANTNPFVFHSNNEYSSKYIDKFQIPIRYTNIAEHIIGYTNYIGEGISGAELAFENILSKYTGNLKMIYNVDALGNQINGFDYVYENSLSNCKSGIILTLDKQIQEIAENESKQIEKGAVVISSIPNCEIKACVSCPNYEHNKLEEYLNDNMSPLINRSFTAFTPGSVFKLLIASTALKYEYNINKRYNCTGSINIDGLEMTCFAHTEHGEVSMKEAVTHSCNCYFIWLAEQIGYEKILEFANLIGIGEQTSFYTKFSTESGNLTSEENLSNQRALANFAIGQGDLTVTPIKIAEIINYIASAGIYSQAKLYVGELTNENEIIYNSSNIETIPLISKNSANLLCNFMRNTVINGTAHKGFSLEFTSGAKTGTAQTGIYENGSELNNYWYAGFICDENNIPIYSIVVLQESAVSGSNKTGDVFKSIAENILNIKKLQDIQ